MEGFYGTVGEGAESGESLVSAKVAQTHFKKACWRAPWWQHHQDTRSETVWSEVGG